MSFYGNLASTATRLLTKYGQSLTFRTQTTFDPVTGVESGSSADTTTIGIAQRLPDNLIDGTRIKQSDKLFVIDSSYEPNMSDKLVIGSDLYSIQDIQTSSPAGTDLVYFVRVRK